jgi:methylase of polypeptide subunit release factors
LATEGLVRTAGVVYTPPWLASFVVDRLLCGTSVSDDAHWLDPSCGDGIFLVEIVRRLASRVSRDDLPNVVERSVFGVEIDRASCELARLAVTATVQELCGRQPMDYFSANVRCADFLDLQPADDERVDLVVGNPPYVSATHLRPEDKRKFLERFDTAWGRLDLYALFIEQGLRFLRPGGSIGYITPDKWLTAQSSGRLRELVTRNHTVRSVDRFERHDLFPGVATVPCVTVVDERPCETAHAQCRWWDVGSDGRPVASSQSEELSLRRDGTAWSPVRASMSRPTAPLGDLVERISVGMATGLNRCFIVDEQTAGTIEPVLLRPVARGRDVQLGGVADAGLWMLVPYRFDERGESAQLVDLVDYPGAQAHLEAHRADLEARHCVRVWSKPWFALHDPVTIDLACRPKILLPDLAHEPRFAMDPGVLLPTHSAYYLLLREDGELDGVTLTALLNSPDVTADLRRRAPTAKSGYRRFRTAVLRDVQIPRDAA